MFLRRLTNRSLSVMRVTRPSSLPTKRILGSVRAQIGARAIQPLIANNVQKRWLHPVAWNAHQQQNYHNSCVEDDKKSIASKSGEDVKDYFGQNVFDQRAMRKCLSPSIYEEYQSCVKNATPMREHVYDEIGKCLLKWAESRGATHYTHWFQPLNGACAEKHDAFLETLPDGETPITRLKGKHLLMGETDGSSFPNGGIRSTHRARAYTTWDPTSPPFILEHSNGSTLYIPACFFSWHNHQALDDKLALLRSEVAVKQEAMLLFEAMGLDKVHQTFHTDSGLEQEFFLVERKHFDKRLDLKVAGRTLIGSLPAKTQELEDSYFGNTSNRFITCIHAFEQQMWKLGVPILTRHREVAPGQYEVAPKFANSNIATDRNLLLMMVLKNVALQHGLAALFHEKPFSDVNGSGKHNNFSFGTNAMPSLLDPGPEPEKNTQFMFFLGIMLRAVDMHGDLLRWATASAGNDHRLGSHEAPPAIVSVYLGESLSNSVADFLKNRKGKSAPNVPPHVPNGHEDHEPKFDENQPKRSHVGIPSLPKMTIATTDRNRTSSFAFTGNKFEYRSVGASQTPSKSNMVLNLILAKSFSDARFKLEECMGTWKSRREQSIEYVAAWLLEKHEKIVFNGNGYSNEWIEEAAKRGLPNLATTPEALAVLCSEKNTALFNTFQVLSPEELEARSKIGYAEYCNKIKIEARILITMVNQHVIPAITSAQKKLASSIASVENVLASGRTERQTGQLEEMVAAHERLLERLEHFKSIIAEAEEKSGPDQATFLCATAIPEMEIIRQISNDIEGMVGAQEWLIPTLQDMLFEQH